MVNPKLIEKFVVPVTSKIGEELGPIRLHSCGPSTNHLEAFSKIANLHSLDLGGETSIRRTREVFGKEMLISVIPLPHDLSSERTDSILRWAKRIFEENDGGNLEYIYHVEPSYNVNTIYALTDFVRSLPGFLSRLGSATCRDLAPPSEPRRERTPTGRNARAEPDIHCGS
jgi:hypothetical protein